MRKGERANKIESDPRNMGEGGVGSVVLGLEDRVGELQALIAGVGSIKVRRGFPPKIIGGVGSMRGGCSDIVVVQSRNRG